MKHHPSLLAFGCTYRPEGEIADSYRIITARNLAEFQALTANLSNVVLTDVHHVADFDGFTLTSIIWKSDHQKKPYTDNWANNSWVFADMDRVAAGEA